MTAEVAVLNRNAVALAADSAVTLRLREGTKIYYTNKLFSLSKYEPVAIMLYGSADFLSVPWETIIKAYRAQLGNRTLASVESYASDFFKFVEGCAFFPPDLQDYSCYFWIRLWLSKLKKKLEGSVEQELKEKGTLSGNDVKALFRKIVSDEGTYLGRHKVLRSLRKLDSSSFRSKCASAAKKAIADELQKLADVIPIARMLSLALRAVRTDAYWQNESGIVIAGFGRDQFFPSLRSFTVDALIAGRLRVGEDQRRADIGNEDSAASVIAFAQSEMVSLFMNGIDDDYSIYVRSFVAQSLLSEYPELVLQLLEKYVPKEDRASALKQLSGIGAKLVSVLSAGLSEYSRDMHSDPIVEIVAHLPKEELAAMAEALVNLTSFKRHVTRQAETVGGPIDVAVISKGDGLIWIKRKHYFQPALNPQFLSNYYRGSQGGSQ